MKRREERSSQQAEKKGDREVPPRGRQLSDDPSPPVERLECLITTWPIAATSKANWTHKVVQNLLAEPILQQKPPSSSHPSSQGKLPPTTPLFPKDSQQRRLQTQPRFTAEKVPLWSEIHLKVPLRSKEIGESRNFWSYGSANQCRPQPRRHVQELPWNSGHNPTLIPATVGCHPCLKIAEKWLARIVQNQKVATFRASIRSA